MTENRIRRLNNQVQDGRDKVRGKTPTAYTVDLYLEGADNREMKQKKRLGCSVCDAASLRQTRSSIENNSVSESIETSTRSQRSAHHRSHSQSHPESFMDEEVEAEPSESYLRGALWLGRNILMVIQDLAADLDVYRSEVNAILSIIALNYLQVIQIVTYFCGNLSLQKHFGDTDEDLPSQYAQQGIDNAIAMTEISRERAKGILEVDWN